MKRSTEFTGWVARLHLMMIAVAIVFTATPARAEIVYSDPLTNGIIVYTYARTDTVPYTPFTLDADLFQTDVAAVTRSGFTTGYGNNKGVLTDSTLVRNGYQNLASAASRLDPV